MKLNMVIAMTTTVDGCEILHQWVDGQNPMKSPNIYSVSYYQLVQDLFHPEHDHKSLT